MNAIELLEGQHREVEQLFKMIEEADSPDEKEALAQDLEDALAGHAAIEEQLFYPAVMLEDTEEQLREAVQEHLSVKRMLVDLMATDAEDQSFDAKLKVLKEQVEHHVGEEEGELFPRVKKDFDADMLEELGEKMEALFAQLEEGNPRTDVPAETDAAASLPEP